MISHKKIKDVHHKNHKNLEKDKEEENDDSFKEFMYLHKDQATIDVLTHDLLADLPMPINLQSIQEIKIIDHHHNKKEHKKEHKKGVKMDSKDTIIIHEHTHKQHVKKDSDGSHSPNLVVKHDDIQNSIIIPVGVSEVQNESVHHPKENILHKKEIPIGASGDEHIQPKPRDGSLHNKDKINVENKIEVFSVNQISHKHDTIMTTSNKKDSIPKELNVVPEENQIKNIPIIMKPKSGSISLHPKHGSHGSALKIETLIQTTHDTIVSPTNIEISLVVQQQQQGLNIIPTIKLDTIVPPLNKDIIVEDQNKLSGSIILPKKNSGIKKRNSSVSSTKKLSIVIPHVNDTVGFGRKSGSVEITGVTKSETRVDMKKEQGILDTKLEIGSKKGSVGNKTTAEENMKLIGLDLIEIIEEENIIKEQDYIKLHGKLDEVEGEEDELENKCSLEIPENLYHIEDDDNELEPRPDTCNVRRDSHGNPCYITINVPRGVADQIVTDYTPNIKNIIGPEIYLINPDVVKLCVELLNKFEFNLSPDEFLNEELKKWYMWNDYDLYLTIEMFFGCLDRHECLKAVIHSFRNTIFAKGLNLLPKDVSQLQVITFLILSESQRIEHKNMTQILTIFNTKPGKAYFEFLLNGCSPDSSDIYNVFIEFYIPEHVEKHIMPNLFHTKNVLKKVLGRLDVSKPIVSSSPLTIPISSYVPFQHRVQFEQKVHDCCMEVRNEPNKHFVAKTIPMSTYYQGQTLEKQLLEKQFAKNRTKAQNLLATVNTLKHINPLYAENKKSAKYLNIMNQIRKEREQVLKVENIPASRIPLEKVFQEPTFRGKLNTTTVMRQLENYRIRHITECEELTKLMEGCTTGINETQIREEKHEDEQIKLAINWGRMLDAKLTYQRAIAATRNVTYRNHQKANQVRLEMDKIKETIANNKKIELEKIHKRAKNICSAKLDKNVRSAVAKLQRCKKTGVIEMKKEAGRLKEIAMLKEEKIRAVKMDKIKQIQADQTIIFRPPNHLNPFTLNKFGKLSEMSDAEAHLRLQMNIRNEAINLVLTRTKIRDEKIEKAIRFQGAIEQIEWYKRQHKALKK